MDLVTRCPLPTNLFRHDTAAGWGLVVVAKATFVLETGMCHLAAVQEPIFEHDLHVDRNPIASLFAASDLVPFKPQADVVLVGSAYAERGEPVARLVAWLKVGEVDKRVEVVGDRVWLANGKPSEAAPFGRMPLRYERAAGGAGTSNPVGIPRPSAMASCGRTLPNLQHPDAIVTNPSDFIAPTGFGPLSLAWHTRDEATHTSGAGREPSEFAHCNAAPVDQRLSEIRPDELLVLEHLHPAIPRLVTNLPGISVRAIVEAQGCDPFDLPLRGDTLWIDTDRQICTITWRGALALPSGDHRGRIVVELVERHVASNGGLAGSRTSPTPHVAASIVDRTAEDAMEGPSPWARAATPPGWTASRAGDVHGSTSSTILRAPTTPAFDANRASDDAARASRPATSHPDPTAAPPPLVALARAPEIELLWYADELPSKLRGRRSWSSLLSQQSVKRATAGDDDGESPERWAVRTLVTRGELDALDGSGAGLGERAAGLRLLVAGEFRFPFDATERLRMSVAVAKPLAGSDQRLKDAIDTAEAHLSVPGLHASPELVERLAAQLRDAFETPPGGRPQAFLGTCCDRALLEGRKYPRRPVLGGTWIRAAFHWHGEDASRALPAYLPEPASSLLPLLPAFGARVVAEPIPRQDALEPSHRALRVAAIARVLP